MSIHFESYAQKGNEFIHHVAHELETKDLAYAGSVTRCVLRALRNRLTPEESFQMMAQLPMALKAVYVDGWKFNREYQRIKHVDDFLDEVLKEFSGFILPAEFSKTEDARRAVEAVFKTISHYVSADEIKDVLAVLPKELKNWFKEIVAA